MKKAFVTPVLAAIAAVSPIAAAQAESAEAAYSVETTSIGDLIDNPATKAVLDAHVPGFADNPQIAMARSMTLTQVAAFSPDELNEDVLAKIDADLAALD